MFVLVVECFLHLETLDVDAGTPHFDAHALQLQNQPDQTHFFPKEGLELHAHEIGEGQTGQLFHRFAVIIAQWLTNAGAYVCLCLVEKCASGLRFWWWCEIALLEVLLEGEFVVMLG